ncbi:HAMP domain-containing sensor histidine kinase [Nitratireductor sp. StC3]|uniref:sensor histidine kinase n=1 Tax=Nitratireductor sp. StC3 TaxID=2126741 RepID=UPI000D0E1DCD|nr:HAMP domain-containing sensor histidine kinase [Nitratireductor sp. StC3]PSM19851.1 ATPase [Nitratireductor sp. StC3]
MSQGSIARTTSFRLAILYLALFLVCYLGVNLVAYNMVASHLSQRLDSHVMERFREIQTAFDKRGLAGASAMIENHGPAIRGQETIYSLRAPDGTLLAGNIDITDASPGFSTLDASNHNAIPVNYRLYRNALGPAELIIGVSYDDTNSLRSIALTSFGWATAILLATGLGGGAFLALRTRKRIAALSAVMREVASGKLSTRLPVSSRMDDIDALAEEVNVSLAYLEASVNAMRQVTTDIAHDLKTPISRLFLLLEAAAQASTLSAAHPLIQTALTDIRAITATFDALLRISQIEAGVQRQRFRRINVNELLQDVFEVYADIAGNNDRHIRLAMERGGQTMLRGDPDLLRQMLANLVQNAISHTPPGSQIEIGSETQKGEVVVVVKDNGPGIPVEERLNVLKRFYRLDKSRRTEGSGLGLSMVKAISDLHGATLHLADNKPGLAVHIRFPKPGDSLWKNPPAEVRYAGG